MDQDGRIFDMEANFIGTTNAQGVDVADDPNFKQMQDDTQS